MGKKNLEDLDTETVAPPGVETTVVTEAASRLPSKDDQSPAVTGDARVDDGGIRTNSAVEPVADVLGTGAGRTVPPPDNVDKDGREVFDDGVAPTALADYDGPGSPAARGETQPDAIPDVPPHTFDKPADAGDDGKKDEQTSTQ